MLLVYTNDTDLHDSVNIEIFDRFVSAGYQVMKLPDSALQMMINDSLKNTYISIIFLKTFSSIPGYLSQALASKFGGKRSTTIWGAFGMEAISKLIALKRASMLPELKEVAWPWGEYDLHSSPPLRSNSLMSLDALKRAYNQETMESLKYLKEKEERKQCKQFFTGTGTTYHGYQVVAKGNFVTAQESATAPSSGFKIRNNEQNTTEGDRLGVCYAFCRLIRESMKGPT
jgi:hypothetical protein